MLPIEFTVVGTPISAQAHGSSRGKWKKRVEGAAKAAIAGGNPAFGVEISATIIYFYVGRTTLDLDNIAKPILDALTGVVYQDDGLLAQITVRKTRLFEGLGVLNPSVALAARLAGNKDFVYVRVGVGPNHSEMP